MADDLPIPEPKEIDEKLSLQLKHLAEDAVLKGVRLGYLPKRYTAYGEKAFYGTCDRHLGVGADGALQLGGICLVAGLGGATRRDGSLAYYFSEPIVENDAKGVGPLLLAYTEILAAQKQ